ncbi:cell death abnormality protein 1 [Biomphalaria glabrata]|nr:cell death abnormality protein 1 [Biomphalaria glabrata]
MILTLFTHHVLINAFNILLLSTDVQAEKQCYSKSQCADNCEPGFFGFMCQYVDFGYHSNSSQTGLFDGDDDTCATINMGVIMVTFSETHLVKFLRVNYFRKEKELNDFMMLEMHNADHEDIVDCNVALSVARYPNEFDVYCGEGGPVTSMEITLLDTATICSIYVSPGRLILESIVVPLPQIRVETTPAPAWSSTSTKSNHNTTPTRAALELTSEAKLHSTSEASSSFPSTWTPETSSPREDTTGVDVSEVHSGQLQWDVTTSEIIANKTIMKSTNQTKQRREVDSKCIPFNESTQQYFQLILPYSVVITEIILWGLNKNLGAGETRYFYVSTFDVSRTQVSKEIRFTNVSIFSKTIHYANWTNTPISMVQFHGGLVLTNHVDELCGVKIIGDCSNGFYGRRCSIANHFTCFNKGSDIETGVCLSCGQRNVKAECNVGPDEMCGHHKYGSDCNLACFSCMGGQCERHTGRCIGDCSSFVACNSKSKCPLFKFGDECQSECKYCYKGLCDIETGECLKGCSDKRFGSYCEDRCSDRCLEMECDNDTFECSKGCVGTYTGGICDQMCSDNCAGEGKCNQQNRSCLEGCLRGYGDSQCIESNRNKSVFLILLLCLVTSLFISIFFFYTGAKEEGLQPIIYE